MTVLRRPRRVDAKNDVENYPGQLLPEKMRFENTYKLYFPHTYFKILM